MLTQIGCSEARHLLATKHLSSGTSSKTSWDMTERLYEQCKSSHTSCQSTSFISKQYFPSRLLDIRQAFKSNERISLVQTKDKLPDGPYCTLSRQWGNQSNKIFELTTKNLTCFKNSFLRSGFPLVFQEPAAAAHSLQLPYLWIDLLCIL